MKNFLKLLTLITLSYLFFTPTSGSSATNSYVYFGNGTIIHKTRKNNSESPMTKKEVQEFLKKYAQQQPIIQCDFGDKYNNFYNPEDITKTEKHEKKFIETPENFNELTGN